MTVSSWLNFGRPTPQKGGLLLGENFWLCLTRASTQCLHLLWALFSLFFYVPTRWQAVFMSSAVLFLVRVSVQWIQWIICFLNTSIYNTLGVSAIMRYINRRFTYLIIYRQTYPAAYNVVYVTFILWFSHDMKLCRVGDLVISYWSNSGLTTSLGKGKGAYTWYSASSQWNTTAEALRYGTCSQWISQFYLHTHTFIRNRNEPYLPLPSQL